MSYSHSIINVRIVDRILWVDDDATPVQQITQVQPRAWTPDYAAAKKAYVKRLCWAIAGGLLLVGATASSSAAAAVVIALCAVGAVVFLTIGLRKVLSQPPLFTLFVFTSGTPNAKLISDNERAVLEIRDQIVRAINDPSVAFQQQVTVVNDRSVRNLVMGDAHQQFGDHNRMVG